MKYDGCIRRNMVSPCKKYFEKIAYVILVKQHNPLAKFLKKPVHKSVQQSNISEFFESATDYVIFFKKKRNAL